MLERTETCLFYQEQLEFRDISKPSFLKRVCMSENGKILAFIDTPSRTLICEFQKAENNLYKQTNIYGQLGFFERILVDIDLTEPEPRLQLKKAKLRGNTVIFSTPKKQQITVSVNNNYTATANKGLVAANQASALYITRLANTDDGRILAIIRLKHNDGFGIVLWHIPILELKPELIPHPRRSNTYSQEECASSAAYICAQLSKKSNQDNYVKKEKMPLVNAVDALMPSAIKLMKPHLSPARKIAIEKEFKEQMLIAYQHGVNIENLPLSLRMLYTKLESHHYKKYIETLKNLQACEFLIRTLINGNRKSPIRDSIRVYFDRESDAYLCAYSIAKLFSYFEILEKRPENLNYAKDVEVDGEYYIQFTAQEYHALTSGTVIATAQSKEKEVKDDKISLSRNQHLLIPNMTEKITTKRLAVEIPQSPRPI